MNDGTNIASDDIILKPKFRYWLMKNFLLITLAIFVFIFSKYISKLHKFISNGEWDYDTYAEIQSEM